MNIVNNLLRRADIGVLPHLYLDQLAYFMQPPNYAEFFEAAVSAHVMNDELGFDRPLTRALLETVLCRSASAQPLSDGDARIRPAG